MAPLISDARAARAQAARLRVETTALKLGVRKSTAHSREQLRTAEVALDRMCARRYAPLPSPWSTLQWACHDDALDLTLVPLP